MRAPTLKKRPHKLGLWIGALALTLAASGCQSVANTAQNPEVVAMAKAGKAYFEEKCKTVAGEKIYRTVADVEGVLLMKVRPLTTETELQDPMWPGPHLPERPKLMNSSKRFLAMSIQVRQ